MDEITYYSVQEFAKKVGVSRQTIYNALSNKLSNYVVTCKGVKMLRAEALCEYEIRNDVQKFDKLDNDLDNQFDKLDNDLDNQFDKLDNDLDNQLYKILREELNYKNKLIDELQVELTKAREEISEERRYSREQFDKIATLASQAQYLQLGQKITKDGSPIQHTVKVTEENANSKIKVGFWKRWFKK